MSKLANRSASRTLWRGGEEGAKGSAKGSLAGREEEEDEEVNSPEDCGRKGPRRWKESEDSVLERDDLLPGTDGDRGQEEEEEEEEVLTNDGMNDQATMFT